jgi:hypothetical protein
VPANDAAASRPITSVNVGGAPDNLWLEPDGRTVLAVTHSDPGLFIGCMLWPGPCASPWSVFEIESRGNGLNVRLILHHDGSVLSHVSAAACVPEGTEEHLVFGAIDGDRIGMQWRDLARWGSQRRPCNAPAPPIRKADFRGG